MLLKSSILENKLIKSFTSIAIVNFFLLLSGKFAINLYGVPFTLVTFLIVLFSFLYNRKIVLTAVIFYILEGLMGAGVFAYGLSWAAIFGANSGYLISMLFIAYLVPYFKSFNKVFRVLATVSVLLVACLFGSLYLGLYIGFEKAIYIGFYIFIPIEILKSVVASSIYNIIKSK